MDIIKLSLDKSNNLNLYLDNSFVILLIIFIVFLIITYVIILYFKYKKNLAMLLRGNVELDGAEIGLNEFKIKIKPNYQTVQIAYKLWVELSTRKLGLLIDLKNDVLEEIYDSWYEFFQVTRELIKEIPAQETLNEDTKQLITIATDVLNQGIRPHLTKWQARFRNWYDIKKEIAKQSGLSPTPQNMQTEFKCAEMEFCYNELATDLLKVNKQLIEYKKLLENIVFG